MDGCRRRADSILHPWFLTQQTHFLMSEMFLFLFLWELISLVYTRNRKSAFYIDLSCRKVQFLVLRISVSQWNEGQNSAELLAVLLLMCTKLPKTQSPIVNNSEVGGGRTVGNVWEKTPPRLLCLCSMISGKSSFTASLLWAYFLSPAPPDRSVSLNSNITRHLDRGGTEGWR